MHACLSLLELARLSIRRVLKSGDLAVDATAGNGNDTLFLAESVGPDGLVLAFDIQPEALKATQSRLEDAGQMMQVRLLPTGHENIAAYLPFTSVPMNAPNSPTCRIKVRAAVFNLGFLPGHAKNIVTKPDTTLAALCGLLPHMEPGGLLSVHCYSRHDGGRKESDAVLEWAQALPEKLWRVLCCKTFNKRRGAENLLLIECRARVPGGASCRTTN